MISKRGLWLRAGKFADSRIALRVWLETAEFASWTSLQDIRKSFSATDMIGKLAIFNITHAEYDKGAWKKWL